MQRNVRDPARQTTILSYFQPNPALQQAINRAIPRGPTANFEMTSRNERYNRREFNMTGDDLRECARVMLESMPADEMIRFHFWQDGEDGQRHNWGTKLKTAQDHLDYLDGDDGGAFDVDIGDSISGGGASGGEASASGGGGGGGEEESPWVQQMSNKALYRIKNDDDLCGQRCLVIAGLTESNRKSMHKRPESFTKKAKLMGKKLSVTGRMNHTHFAQYATMFKRQVT